MEHIDRQFLEQLVGTNPNIDDLESLKELIDEWIAELKEEGDN